MDLDELRVLLSVAETGSVLSASERLKLPRATVRRRLEALEARIGAPLLYRGPSGALLTDAGQLVAKRARSILEAAGAMLASAREEGATVGGVLRVLLPVGLPPHVMTPVFGALRMAHPRLSVHARFADDPLAAPLDDVDLVFHFGARVVAGPWVTRVVMPLQECLLASRAYLDARGTPTSPRDLAGHDILVWARPGGDPRSLPTRTGDVIPVTPIGVASDIHLLRQLALAGIGIAFLPEGGFTDPGEPLVTLLPDVVGRDCPFRMLVPEAMSDSPKVRKLLEGLEGFLSADG